MSNRLRLQTAPYYWRLAPAVDWDRQTISGAVSMTADTEALGHGIMTDARTLEITNELAHRHRGGLGIQGRFGHPGMSENSMGRKFMLSNNFRIEDNALRHDIQLMPPASLSPAFGGADVNQYVLQMADEQPGEIAESFVMDTDIVWLMADGRELNADQPLEWEDSEDLDPTYHNGKRPINALNPLPVMRPIQLLYLDMVNEGALTHDGLFSAEAASRMFDGTSNVYSQEFFAMLDQFRAEFGIPLDALEDKALSFLGKYLGARGFTMPNPKAKPAVEKGATQRQPGRAALAAAVAPLKPVSAAEDFEVLDESEVAAGSPAQPAPVTPSTPPAPPPEDEEAETDDALDAAAADLEDEQEDEDDSVPPEVLAAQVAYLSERLERAISVIGKQSAAIKQLRKDVARIDGEPIGQDRVGKFSANRLRSMGAGQGQPPARLQATTPRGMEKGDQAFRGSDGAAAAPIRRSREQIEAQAVLNANSRRNRNNPA